ncbi:hypothetical protein Tco_0151985 [Tanacetum coccineum]
MPPKRASTTEAPAMTQDAIRKLVADSVTSALEAQAATMASLVARSTGMMIGVRPIRMQTELWNFKFSYLHKLNTVSGRDRATCLKAEDIAEACEDNNNKGNAFLSSSTHIEDEVFMVPSKQNPPTVPSISHTKKQKLLPRTNNKFSQQEEIVARLSTK